MNSDSIKSGFIKSRFVGNRLYVSFDTVFAQEVGIASMNYSDLSYVLKLNPQNGSRYPPKLTLGTQTLSKKNSP